MTPDAVVLDSGALIAVERHDGRVRALLKRALDEEKWLIVPASVVAEVWRGGAGRRALLSRFLIDGVEHGDLTIDDLDFEAALEVGLLLARANVSVADAAVVRAAVQRNALVLTSDPKDIGRLLPDEQIEVI
jgi:rRNA-processing protein FCF1